MTATPPFFCGKPWWQSRGVLGAVAVILGVVLRHYGWIVDQGKLTDDLSSVMELFGGAVSLWGRIAADQPIVWKRGTVPGGPFNPAAEVRKAQPIDSEQGAAVLHAIIALAACAVISVILVACHPTTPEAGGKVERSESGKVIRDPEVPRILHPVVAASAPSHLPTFYFPTTAALLRSLTVTPGMDIGTNSHGQTIYGPSITLRGGVTF